MKTTMSLKLLSLVMLLHSLQSFALSADQSLMLKLSMTNESDAYHEFAGGDIIGNGKIFGDPELWSIDDQFIYLKEDQVNERNEQFNIDLRENQVDDQTQNGGDIIGNGSGVLETHASFYMNSIEQYISSALEQNSIFFDETQRKTLGRILTGLNFYPPYGKLVYLDPQHVGDFFFKKGVDLGPRLAKTGFHMSYPIFINSDALYRQMNTSPRFLLGMIIHELGHQVGVRSHSFLDELGSKVILVSEQNKKSIRRIVKDSKVLKITVQNHSFDGGQSEVFASYGDQRIKITNWNTQELEKACEGGHLKNISIKNLHWITRMWSNYGTLNEYSVMGWLDLKCQSRIDGHDKIMAHDYKLDLILSEDQIITFEESINLAN